MEKGWDKVFETTDRFQAEVIQQMLQENDVEAIAINKQDSAYVMIGQVEIYVQHENVLKAIHLIKNRTDEQV